MSNNSSFKKKAKVVFVALAVVCFFTALSAMPFMFKSLQNYIVGFVCKILGRSLNASYWQAAILARAKFTFIFGIVLGIAFILLSRITFDGECDFKLSFSPRFLFFDKKYFIAVLLVFACVSSVRFYWLLQKQTFHIDEIYEIGIINRNEYGFWNGDRIFYKEKEYERNVPILGMTIKENAFFDNASVADGLKDIVHLYLYCNDPPHTGLYYILQRLAFLGKKTFDIKTIFIRSFFVNYFIFAFAFYAMLLLLQKLTDSKPFQIVALFAAFVNPASIGNSLFFRPFILQEFSLILFAYVFASFYSAIKDEKPVASKTAFLQGVACLGFALVSEYFSLFFVAFLGLFIIAVCVRKKRFDAISFFVTMFFAGFVAAKILYPDFGIGFFDSRRDSAPGAFARNISFSVSTTLKFIEGNFLPIFVFCVVSALCVAFFAFAIKRKLYANELPAVIAFCAVFFMLLCNFFAPFKNEIRYTAPVFVFLPLILIPPFYIRGGTGRAFVLAVQLCLSLFAACKSFPMDQNKENIVHLTDTSSCFTNPKYNKDAHIPVVIQLPVKKWAIYPYVNESQTYWFVDSFKDFDTSALKSKAFWLVTVVEENGERRLDEHLIEE